MQRLCNNCATIYFNGNLDYHSKNALCAPKPVITMVSVNVLNFR
jgi:hypothetical protein